MVAAKLTTVSIKTKHKRRLFCFNFLFAQNHFKIGQMPPHLCQTNRGGRQLPLLLRQRRHLDVVDRVQPREERLAALLDLGDVAVSQHLDLGVNGSVPLLYPGLHVGHLQLKIQNLFN